MLFIIALLIAVCLFYNFYYKRCKLPPGPIPLPLIGNVLTIARHEPGEECFAKWRREYGPIFTYWLGEIPVVCVADYKSIIDNFVKDGDAYVDRFNFPFEKEFRGEKINGVIGSSGNLWREQRRFALHVFRDFGLGKNLMQERILTELIAMFDKINENIEKSDEQNLPELIDVAIGSIINNLMFGYRFEGEKEAEFWEIKRLMNEHMKLLGADPLAQFFIAFPKISIIPPFKKIKELVVARLNRFFGFFKERIEQHQKEFDQMDQNELESPPKDFVEAFLKEMARRKKAQDGIAHYFTIEQLENMCFDLWIAGQETTANVLMWSLAFLLNNPDSLNKLYAELDTVIGSDRLITFSDRAILPYTNAVINESLRMANILPQNIIRRVTGRDVVIEGHKLAAGTRIVPQISVVLIDEKIFPEPKLFNPDRYIDSDGNLKRSDELITFSIGKRQCLGESLARMELFFFIANIFNQYMVSPGQKMPSLQRQHGAVIRCQPFTCRIKKRY